ncbi:MAG: response regulator [Candidatus Marinimicrobia bacterium]|nr:response regulator [Candidatus Neomarinimicrobiota bacterium]
MKTILIVDDKAEVRELVEVTLRVGDYRILQADNGDQAVEIAQAERPDLMLLDVMMPGGMDGFEVCERLKSDPATQGITIIMLTAKGQQVDKERGSQVKADGYYTKPFSPLELLQKVEEVLGE